MIQRIHDPPLSLAGHSSLARLSRSPPQPAADRQCRVVDVLGNPDDPVGGSGEIRAGLAGGVQLGDGLVEVGPGPADQSAGTEETSAAAASPGAGQPRRGRRAPGKGES